MIPKETTYTLGRRTYTTDYRYDYYGDQIITPEETTYTLGRYKYLVRFGSPTNVRVLKDGLQYNEMNFPTEQHFMCFLRDQHSID